MYEVLIQAILLVRGKRPLSVQTKKQALFVARFESYLKSLQLFFPSVISKTQKDEVPCDLLNFHNFMANQRWWLSIEEVRYLRTVPKVICTEPDRSRNNFSIDTAMHSFR
jgi:hypothetical protein